jgi:hypothetical protein
MTLLKKALILTFAVGMAAPLVGCAEKKPDGMPDLHPTTVTLTVDGKGLAEANVTLMPADSQASQWVSAGVTDSSGKAEIKTSGQYSGAPVGNYKVVVSAKEEVDYGEDGPPPPREDAAALEDWSRKANPNSWKRYSPVAIQYTNVAETPLEASVQAGKNAFDFDLGAATRDEVKQEKK